MLKIPNITIQIARILFVFCISYFSNSLQAASIFVLHSYSQEYNWTKRQHSGFIQQMQALYQNDLTIQTEYLDTKRQTFDDKYASEMARHLTIKYSGYHPDIVYVSDDNALKFAQSYLLKLFPQAPVIFSGVACESYWQSPTLIDRSIF